MGFLLSHWMEYARTTQKRSANRRKLMHLWGLGGYKWGAPESLNIYNTDSWLEPNCFRHSTTRNQVKRPYLDTVGTGSGVMNNPR
jgi:hypothetical protein